jgi:hypothetical protein
VTAGTDLRDVTAALAGATILVDEQATSASSGKTVRRLIARQRTGAGASKR